MFSRGFSADIYHQIIEIISKSLSIYVFVVGGTQIQESVIKIYRP